MGLAEEQIFKKYFPDSSVAYCLELWAKYKIQFTISKPRKTLYGNYMFRSGIHSISVNGDLNPDAFLVTYLHEVAHLLVQVNFKSRRLPHGKEWQMYFRELVRPMIEKDVFDKEIGEKLWEHLQSPKATSCSDPELHHLLMKDQNSFHSSTTGIVNMSPGQHFIHDARTFKILKKLRTRYECLEIKTSRIYRFHATSKVRMVDLVEEIENNNSEFFPVNLLPLGSKFEFGNKVFILKEKRRTRFLCEGIADKKLYLINQMSEVSPK